MFFRVLARCVVVLAILVSASALNYFVFRSHAASPAAEAKHGLTGNYYLGARGWQTDAPPPSGAFYQVWSDQNDFMLPRTITTPAAIRVDAQVAFGQGKGFHVGQKGPMLIWWPTGYAIPQGWGYKEKPWEANHFVAVVWKGYIHLPKAGTYYFGTVSNGASAVYLNQARVALNGWGGGVLVSDAYSYASEQVQDFVTQNSTAKDAYLADPRFQYDVPVPVDGPRDLPIEVDYDVAKSPSGWGNVALGIDLFWVAPDSPRDANGKPTANIVPSEALYTEAPGPIEKPLVRSANSTISADYFYVAAKSDNFVTVTVRLADKDGNPVARKRVSLASVGAQRDEIVQPEKPTNEQGETTGKIRGYQGYSVPHDTTIFAADVTDFVDVAQVGHVMFTIPAGSFFPDSFSPYYDPHAPEVTPEPLQVGRQVTVKMPLVNRNTYAADLEVIFEIHEFNIGASDWQEIGRVKNVRLQPGEHKDASIQWTPDKATGHICFRVSVNAMKVASVAQVPQALSASLLPFAFEKGGKAPQGNQPNGDTKQDNKGAVQLPPCGQPQWGGGKNEFPPSIPTHAEPCKPNDAERKYCEAKLPHIRQEIQDCEHDEADDIAKGDMSGARIEVQSIYQLQEQESALEHCAKDPSDPAYQRLAMADSDTPTGYLAAMTKSWERYQGAEADGDGTWMARHLTAQNLYFRRYVQAVRSTAEITQKQAESLPPDDPDTLAKLQTARDQFLERWRQGQRFTPDQLNSLKQVGITEQQATAVVEAILAQKEISPVRSLRTVLLETAAEDRKSADQAELVANAPANSGQEGKPGQPLIQTYAVANPHDRQETVDLFIRPISIPADWKLSIVNAEERQTGGEATKPGTQPKYPVHELDPGKHYNITLPAKTETKVASVVIPVGEIGARTTARWAVEGKIGNELIGGMVHEMNVPYIIPDLQLPPVGSKEIGEELPAAGRPWTRLIAELAAAIIVAGLVMFFFIFWRRRRRTTTGT